MFCPNCGKETNEQKFCRDCGLRVEKIFSLLVEEIQEREKTSIQKRNDVIRKLGVISLSLSFGLGFSFIFFLAVFYKFYLFGANVMSAIGLTVMIVLAFLSLIFFKLPKLLDREKMSGETSRENQIEEIRVTEKLLSKGNFEPVPSVTENSTELLLTKNKTRKF